MICEYIDVELEAVSFLYCRKINGVLNVIRTDHAYMLTYFHRVFHRCSQVFFECIHALQEIGFHHAQADSKSIHATNKASAYIIELCGEVFHLAGEPLLHVLHMLYDIVERDVFCIAR